MAFDDGTPLDAAKLQSLETELFNLKASMPKIGSSTTNINFAENKSIVQTQILGGICSSQDLVRGVEKQFTIEYDAESTPLAVILTPYRTGGNLKGGQLSYYVSKIGSNSATVNVLLSKTATGNMKIRFSYMVICA